jgi:hypothetical protein
MSRKELIAKQDAAVKDFCRTLSAIAKSMHNKNKADTDLSELREHLSVAIKDVPLDIFLEAGKHVWDNRKDIFAGSIEGFLKNDYKKEITGYVKDESEQEYYGQMVAKIKRTWRFFNTDEKAEMIKKVQNLVKQYAIYEAAKRELKGEKKPAKKSTKSEISNNPDASDSDGNEPDEIGSGGSDENDE